MKVFYSSWKFDETFLRNQKKFCFEQYVWEVHEFKSFRKTTTKLWFLASKFHFFIMFNRKQRVIFFYFLHSRLTMIHFFVLHIFRIPRLTNLSHQSLWYMVWWSLCKIDENWPNLVTLASALSNVTCGSIEFINFFAGQTKTNFFWNAELFEKFRYEHYSRSLICSDTYILADLTNFKPSCCVCFLLNELFE